MSGDDTSGGKAATASFSRQTLVSLLAQAITLVSGILVTPLVFKFSGASTYGAYVLLVSVASLLSGVSSFGIGSGAKRYLPSADTSMERAALFYPQFWANQIITVTFATILFALWQGTSHWTSIASFDVLFVCVLLLLQGLYRQGGDYLRATHRIVAFNIVIAAQPLIYVVLVLLSFWYSSEIGLHTLLLAQLASISLMAALGLARIMSDAGIRFGLPTISSLREDILLGGPLVLAYLVDTVLAFSDRYIIGFMLSVEDVAYYAAAYTLASLPLFLVKAITIVLLPRLSRLVDSNREAEGHQLLAQMIRLFLIFAIPFLAGVTVLGRDVMTLYTTPAGAEEAKYALPLIAAGTIFYGLFVIYTTVSYVLLDTRRILRSNLAAAVLNVGLNIALLQLLPNIAVAAVTTLFSYLLILYAITRGLERAWLSAFAVPYLLRLVGASAGMALIVFALASMWPEPPGNLLHTAMLTTVGLASYAALAVLTGALSAAEITQLKRAMSLN